MRGKLPERSGEKLSPRLPRAIYSYLEKPPPPLGSPLPSAITKTGFPSPHTETPLRHLDLNFPPEDQKVERRTSDSEVREERGCWEPALLTWGPKD